MLFRGTDRMLCIVVNLTGLVHQEGSLAMVHTVEHCWGQHSPGDLWQSQLVDGRQTYLFLGGAGVSRKQLGLGPGDCAEAPILMAPHSADGKSAAVC